MAFNLDEITSVLDSARADREALIARIAAERWERDEERSKLIPAAVLLIRTTRDSIR